LVKNPSLSFLPNSSPPSLKKPVFLSIRSIRSDRFAVAQGRF
jgi:hypothetical protein